MARRAVALLLLGLLAVQLAACGFQLRGSMPLPVAMEQTYISGADRPLLYELEAAILASGGRVAASSDEASAVLTIHQQRFSRRELGIDPAGRVNAYEHRLQLVFSLRDQRGREIATQQRVSVIREQFFSPDHVLAMGEEQEALQREMRRQAIAQMLHRLRVLEQRQE